MKLFKQLQADINEARQQDESDFPEAELVARKLGLLPEFVDTSKLPKDDDDDDGKENYKCYDCGSTIKGRHTKNCDMAEKGDKKDLPNKPNTQYWTGKLLKENTDEPDRIAAYWRSHGGMTMSDGELRTKVASDLESLEYTPEQVDLMVPKIIKMIRK